MKRILAVTLVVAVQLPGVAVASDPYAGVRAHLVRAIQARLMSSEGGVWSYVVAGSQEDPRVAGTGHDQTAESTGLLLAYAATARDWTLFARARSFWARRLRAGNGLTYWKVDARDRPARNADGSFSSAPIDELRIAKALYRSGAAGTKETVAAEGRALLGAVRNGIVTDDVSWSPWAPSPGTSVAVQYLDIAAMRYLAALVPEWRSIANASLTVTMRAVPLGLPPRTLYNFRAYGCEASLCETTPGLWIALHLYDQSQRDLAYRVYSFYTTAIRRYGGLADAYTGSGRPSADQDLSSYALLARLALRLGNRAYAKLVIDKFILPKRIRAGANAGLFTMIPGDAPSFDNLQILLTLEEFGVHRVLAD